MAIPLQKLKFVNHPRYGQVYPVVAIDNRNEYPNVARVSTALLSVFNGLLVYSTFYLPIFTAEFASIVAHPMVFLPSLVMNYVMYRRNYSLFYMDRSMVSSLFLKPCGTKFIIETRNGESKDITITDVFLTKYLSTRFYDRIEFQHGANNYVQIRGNARIMDTWVLDRILDNKNIDTKNVEYDFDFTKEFTWDFRDLVEIKKRKRYVVRTLKPTVKVLNQVRSAIKFQQARKNGTLVTKRKVYDDYKLFDYYPDTEIDQIENAEKATAQNQLNVSNAGKPIRKVQS